MRGMMVRRYGNLVFSFEQTGPQTAVCYASDGKVLVKGFAELTSDFTLTQRELDLMFLNSSKEALNRKNPKNVRFKFISGQESAKMSDDPTEYVTVTIVEAKVRWSLEVNTKSFKQMSTIPSDLQEFFEYYPTLEVLVEPDEIYHRIRIEVKVGNQNQSAYFTDEYLSQGGAFRHAIDYLIQKALGDPAIPFDVGGPVSSSSGAGQTLKLLNDLFDLTQSVWYCDHHGVLCGCDNKREVPLKTAVINMNDSLKKTRNEIADALEALDLDLEMKGDVKAAQTTGG